MRKKTDKTYTMSEKSRSIVELILRKEKTDISKYDLSFLNKSIRTRMDENQCVSQQEYLSLIDKNPIERKLLINSLNVSYSEFFRNSLTFSVLEKIIIPSIIMNKISSQRKEIRIWSAACAAGQETYSLAILLKEFSIATGERINFRIFATDQSEAQIKEAQQGKYDYLSISNLSLKRADQWFTKSENRYHVKDELKEHIDFSVFDLLNEQYSCPPSSIFGDFDLVLCANLLFYYQPEFRTKIIEKTSHSLSNIGFLITSETERETLLRYHFIEVFPQSAIFRQSSENICQ